MRSRLGSVRVRTTALATVVVAVALLVGAATVVLLQRSSMIAGVDQTARTHAANLAALLHSGALPPSISAGQQEDSFAQIVDRHGHVVAASDNIAGEAPVIARNGSRSVRTVRVTTLEAQFRVAALRASTPGSATVYVGQALSPVNEATNQLITLLSIGVPALLVVVAGTAWMVTGRALKPVEAIRAEVAAISERELHRRVPEPPTGDEISRLARTMNAMLARLDDAYERQSRFVSDASHELQSPIAALRTNLEVDLAQLDRTSWVATQREALEDVTSLQSLVQDLLTLARMPPGRQPRRREPVDLDDLVLREAHAVAERELVHVDLRGVSAGQVEGDPGQLARAIRNLVENAERHAASTITLAVQEHDSAVEITVADDGAGIAPEDRQRIFERFARLDDARTPHTSGSGLGLAIASEIVRQHGGTLTVADNRPGARFVMLVPAASPSS
jgi:signal transduction histidine kinase